MKKIVVIGANSALAKDVIPALAKDNEIITAGRTNCDIYCDVTKAVQLPEGTDVVINFAAHFGGPSDQDIYDAIDANVLGALRICEAARTAHVWQIIMISSIFATLPVDSSSYSIYALTKKQADEVAAYYCQIHNIPLTILRPSRIYGDSDAFRKNQPFLYQIADNARDHEKISIYGTHDAKRNYIHSNDIAEILRRAIDKQLTGIYNTVYPVNVTYSQIVRAAQETYGAGELGFDKEKPDIPDDVFPLDTTLYDKINYQPQISPQTGIRRIKEYREGGDR